ncbi:cofactor-independent phosphoglycerate mutase [archaeon BMS3Abin17]|nr:cofactor-independent phosphoglycerate mutase [archaeon BMS3Abin17]HDZ61064.1 2,3-bisphosphoglycerate-independent phosphoglycerate mutase [Candidatus Pacearchaeota archaeon]
MKGILVIIDGMGDLPNKLLGEKTPLEDADTPNMDFLATRGEMGLLYPVKPGFIPESDEAIVSIFGNDLMFSTRGQLEARGAGIDLTRGDLAMRVNFATIDSLEDKNIIDRRAGRTLTTEEAEILAKALNKINLPCKFVFEPTVQHRAVLVFRGGFSDNITGNDATYVQGKSKEVNKISNCKPMDEEDNSQYSANIVNEFIGKAFEILNKHPINNERRRKGLLPANYLLVRGAGSEKPKLKPYKKWLSPSYMPLEIGFSEVCGMKVVTFDYPKLESLDSYENLYEGLEKACNFSIKALKKNHKDFDYAYIHIKETDLPGHDNKPVEKKTMIEYIDKTLIKFIRKFAPPNKIKVLITADHSTPCKLKHHSADPVPVLFYNNSIPKEKKFSEKEAARGTLGRINGKDLFKKIGFNK